jgi:transcriptional regulator with PAS, ATPase and Fis domain
LESEFFGYASGAFTGAQKGGKLGKFAVADGGTLFLDEIGDMSRNLQSKLLRVLEDKCFEPVGANQSSHVNVRVIAATNQDLWKNVQQGEFRQDLYYRLNVINIKLLPLRDRPEDIVPLVHTFLQALNKEFGTVISEVSPEARTVLLAHDWPGNVRELKNVIERAVNFSSCPVLQLRNLPNYLMDAVRMSDRVNKPKKNRPVQLKPNLDKQSIVRELDRAKGKKAQAARTLGISRTWLYEKMREYDLH